MSAAPAAAAPPTSRPASILTPFIDLLCVGGLSLIVLVPLLLSGREDLDFVSVGAVAWTAALVNYSHFMASYRIIYRDREMIFRHKWASIGVPLILLAWCVAAFAVAGTTDLPVVALFVVSSGYLAWHYTGQVWGMMASYAFLEGTGFDRTERALIRGGLRILLAWHVSWFLHLTLTRADQFAPVYQVMSALTVVAFVLGGLGLWRMRLRTGRWAPLRSIVAWTAIFAWYAAFARWGLPALILVQLAHAIQYLEFPTRVELNRAVRAKATRAASHMALYGGALLAASFLVILAVPGPAMSALAHTLGTAPNAVAPALLLYFINIHHYFTDGVAWKISNPEVRRELFAHVPAPATAGAGPAQAGRKRRKAKR